MPPPEMSLPVRGAWIEIHSRMRRMMKPRSSLPVRGAWIEMYLVGAIGIITASLPVRGAWIEMAAAANPNNRRAVAPRAGSVD